MKYQWAHRLTVKGKSGLLMEQNVFALSSRFVDMSFWV
jgi:hypothetical protein